MALRIIVDGVDNGYIITKNRPGSPGIPEETRVAIDVYDMFVELAEMLDCGFDVLAVRFRRLGEQQ